MRFILSFLIIFASQIWATGLRVPYSSAYLKHHPDSCAFVEFSSHAMMSMALNGDHIAKWKFPERGIPPHFDVVAEGGQSALRSREAIDGIKQALASGKYEYEALDARIGGHYDGARATYIVSEGRHRLNAALEIAHESGNWRPFISLINFGRWNLGRVPEGARSLHFRSHSAPIKDIYSTLEQITPREFMPSKNQLLRIFQNL